MTIAQSSSLSVVQSHPTEQCLEFESEDGGKPGPELTFDDVPF